MTVERHRGAIDRVMVGRWVSGYEDAWRSEGTDRLAELFTEDATYLTSPWREPIHGIVALGGFWEAERDGPDEVFTMSSAVVAVDGMTAVVRVDVEYEHGRPWRDLWVLRFAEDGRVAAFVERRVCDRGVVKLLRCWLRAGIFEGGVVSDTDAGTPQGSPMMPLLANIVLHNPR